MRGGNINVPMDFDLFYQTWPTEAEMAEADRNQKQKNLKKRILPRGTSEYQVCVMINPYISSLVFYLFISLFIKASVSLCWCALT